MRAIPALAALLLLVSGGCAPEVTTPQGAAATARVVPMAIPDKWYPAVPDTTPEDKRRCHPYAVPDAPAPKVAVDSLPRDSIAQP